MVSNIFNSFDYQPTSGKFNNLYCSPLFFFFNKSFSKLLSYFHIFCTSHFTSSRIFFRRCQPKHELLSCFIPYPLILHPDFLINHQVDMVEGNKSMSLKWLKDKYRLNSQVFYIISQGVPSSICTYVLCQFKHPPTKKSF